MTPTREDFIDRIRLELNTRGWCQGRLYDKHTGGCCLMGAMYYATFYYHNHGINLPAGVIDGVGAELEEATGDTDTVGSWNDAPERTFRDVMELLDSL